MLKDSVVPTTVQFYNILTENKQKSFTCGWINFTPFIFCFTELEYFRSMLEYKFYLHC